MTAFVAKVFAVARYLVSIETRLICDAIRFLILQAQQPDGRFTEVGTILQGGIAVRTLITVTEVLIFCAKQK